MRSSIILLFLISCIGVRAQSEAEFSALRGHYATESHEHKWEIAQENNSAMELVLSSLFLFYKHFISSQDSQHCSFDPSCSVYAVEAVRKHGFIIGLLDTFDRLSRCNGMSPENYPQDEHKHLLVDPVTNIRNNAQ
jgi:uncharacterized protein